MDGPVFFHGTTTAGIRAAEVCGHLVAVASNDHIRAAPARGGNGSWHRPVPPRVAERAVLRAQLIAEIAGARGVSVKALSARTGANPPTVRRALNRLASEGLVERYDSRVRHRPWRMTDAGRRHVDAGGR
jgi:DNA-binding transcriptional ArsR family regulator